MSGATTVLVAGVGNIFLGDDAFGSELARRLMPESWPEGVRVVDYGIGGIHLAYDLLDRPSLLILLDATDRGGSPGTVYVIDVDAQAPDRGLDAHSMDPASVFASVETLGGTPPRTLLVGCEPEKVQEGIGLSSTVSLALDRAATEVRHLVATHLDDGLQPVSVPGSDQGGRGRHA